MKLTLVIVVMALATAAGLSSEETAAGKKLYLNKCGRCHKFYKIDKYPSPAWHMWLGQMIAKAKLTPEQADLLTRYLQSLRASHAENGASGGAAQP